MLPCFATSNSRSGLSGHKKNVEAEIEVMVRILFLKCRDLDVGVQKTLGSLFVKVIVHLVK